MDTYYVHYKKPEGGLAYTSPELYDSVDGLIMEQFQTCPQVRDRLIKNGKNYKVVERVFRGSIIIIVAEEELIR